MKHQAAFVVAIISAVLVSTVAPCQRCSGSEAAQSNRSATPQPSRPAAKATQPFPHPNWMVKYTAGSLGLKSDQWLKIDFLPHLASSQITNAALRLPAGQLVRIEFNAKTEKESLLLQGPRSGCSYARSMMPNTTKNPPEDLVAIQMSPGRVARLAESLRSKHPVRFVWNEGGEQKSMTVKVEDCEYQSFLANVRWIVGVRWQEIAHEINK
jgi:hypothetical protein